MEFLTFTWYSSGGITPEKTMENYSRASGKKKHYTIDIPFLCLAIESGSAGPKSCHINCKLQWICSMFCNGFEPNQISGGGQILPQSKRNVTRDVLLVFPNLWTAVRHNFYTSVSAFPRVPEKETNTSLESLDPSKQCPHVEGSKNWFALHIVRT